MSVWKSDENGSFLHPLFSLLKSFCLGSNIKHLTQCFIISREETPRSSRQKYCTPNRIFDSLLSVSSVDETLRLMLDILLLSFTNVFLEGFFLDRQGGYNSF